jgi:hypothetical protein
VAVVSGDGPGGQRQLAGPVGHADHRSQCRVKLIRVCREKARLA